MTIKKFSFSLQSVRLLIQLQLYCGVSTFDNAKKGKCFRSTFYIHINYYNVYVLPKIGKILSFMYENDS